MHKSGFSLIALGFALVVLGIISGRTFLWIFLFAGLTFVFVGITFLLRRDRN